MPARPRKPRATCFVYVLGCRHRGRTWTYVGWTLDIERRLSQHNAGTGARFTRGRQWVVLHVERHGNRQKAMSREWHLKRDRNFRRSLVLNWSSTPAAAIPI
jgi:putative endonuclease